MRGKLFYEARPSLLSEWDDENELSPVGITAGSGKRVRWKGVCGHRWEAIVKNRVRGADCPICSGNLIVTGINDLASRNPKLAAEWSEKNLPLRPDMVGSGSPRSVWWHGVCGHEWQSRIADRMKGHGCPYCARNGRVLHGFSDLGTTHPDLVKEWAPRNKAGPREFTERSRSNVWWKCRACGEEWQMVIQTRVNGSGCPFCRKESSEQHFRQYLEQRVQKHAFQKVRMQFMIEQWLYQNHVLLMRGGENIIGLPLSIYLPELLMAIECSEIYRKSTKWRVREEIKNDLCLKSRIRMIRVLEPGIEPFYNCKCICRLDNSEEAYAAVLEQLDKLLDWRR